MSSLQLPARAGKWWRSAADVPELDAEPVSRGWRLASRLPLALALLALAAASALLLARGVYRHDVYPGVIVADVPVGGLSSADAAARLDARVQSLDGTLITFQLNGAELRPSFAELGVRADVDASVADAFAVGRESVARQRVGSLAAIARGDVAAPLHLTIDEQALSGWFDRLDDSIGQPARDAELQIGGGRVTVAPEASGTGVDRARARALIDQALSTLAPVSADLPRAPIPPALTGAELEPTRLTIANALAQPVVVTYDGSTWPLSANDLGAFVRTSNTPDAQGSYASIDRDALAGWLGQMFADRVNQSPKDAVLGWDDGLYVVDPAVNGVTLLPASFADLVATSLLGDHAAVTLPVQVEKPNVDGSDLSVFGITTLLGSGDSNYEGSEESRATNIGVGSKLLNNTLVPPGGIFSFNHAIGEITLDKGYVEAAVIAAERVGRDIGGGICQVSTTVFRAAFESGLPIVEGWPHLYRLGFYEQDGWPPGLDASIVQPEGDPFGGGDFRFQNPSDSWLLVTSYADGARIYVNIYGPDLGYTVAIDGPMMSDPIPPTADLEVVDWNAAPGTVTQSERAQAGLETRYVRTVTDRTGNVVVSDDWYTRFAPRGNVWTVSPDMAGQSPASGVAASDDTSG